MSKFLSSNSGEPHINFTIKTEQERDVRSVGIATCTVESALLLSRSNYSLGFDSKPFFYFQTH